MQGLNIQKCLTLGVSTIFLGMASAHASCPSLSMAQAKEAEQKGFYKEWKVFNDEGKLFSEPKRHLLGALHPDFKKDFVSISPALQRQGSGALKGKETCIYYVTNGEPLTSREYLAAPLILHKDKVLSLKELASLKVADLIKDNVIKVEDLHKLPAELIEELKRYSHE